MNLQITLEKNNNVAFINNADCPNRFSFDAHLYTSKFLSERNKKKKQLFGGVL